MIERAGISCARIRKQLPLLCGNDESAAVTRVAWAHLAVCASCREHWRSFGRARAALAEVDANRDVVPPAFFTTLQRDILSAVSAVGAVPGTSRALRRRRLVAGAAAAALVVAGAWLFQPAAPIDLLTRPAILSTPVRGPAWGEIQEISLPLQGLGAQEAAVQDLRLLLDDHNGWVDETRELQDGPFRRRPDGRDLRRR